MTNKVSRRDFVKQSATLGLGLMATTMLSKASILTTEQQVFTLPALNYKYDSLEPHIDALTMEIHYSKHHQGYVNNLNKAIDALPNDVTQRLQLDKYSLINLLANIKDLPTAVRNNAGGHYNHTLYWELMSATGGGNPTGELATKIDTNFGSFEAFKTAFTKAASTHFGSGWAWLIAKEGNLHISTTDNQDNPLMHVPEVTMNGHPILCIDVWEHAYYLKNQNKRADYIASWFNVINWEAANKRLSI
jgi:superoxide dismutase, Fe-Mn family